VPSTVVGAGSAVGRLRSTLRAHPVATVFVIALVLRWALSAGFSAFIGGAVFMDDGLYVQLATDVATSQTGHWDEYTRWLYHATATYTYLLTALFWLVTPSMFLGQLITGMFGAVTAALVVRLGMEAMPRKYGFLAGLAIAVLPSQVLWSSLTLKDAVTWSLLASLAMGIAVTMRTSGRRLAVVGAGLLLPLAGLYFVRAHIALVALWAMAITAWLAPAAGRWQRVAATAIAVLVLPWSVGMGPLGIDFVRAQNDPEDQRALMAQGADTAFVVPELNLDDDVRRQLREAGERLREREEALAAARAAGDADTSEDVADAERDAAQARQDVQALQDRYLPPEVGRDQLEQWLAQEAPAESAEPRPTLDEWLSTGDDERGEGLLANLRHLPRGLTVMLLEPLPWRSTGNRSVDLARVDMLLWYPMLALAVVGAVTLRGRRLRVLAFPLVVGGGIATMHALIQGNLGTAFRHRGEFVWAVALLAAAGVCRLVLARHGDAPTS
jgi:hypothetical protein